MKKSILLIAILAFSFQTKAQKINWISLNKALELQKENPKKIMIDVYTNWCGPCKMLDKFTFSNKDLADYVNKNYYAVKFNGEGNDSINYKGQVFKNPRYDKKRASSRNSSHEFSNYMRISGYPTIAFLSETGDFIIPLTGYYKVPQLELYLKLFKGDKYKEMTTKENFEKYQKSFKSEFKVK